MMMAFSDVFNVIFGTLDCLELALQMSERDIADLGLPH